VRYFRYRPLNLAPFATTAIFPSSREIVTLSPRFPVRLSTLILSWRNFSKADGSKILSFAGAVASSTYWKWENSRLWGRYLLRLFLWDLFLFVGFLKESAYCMFTAKRRYDDGTYRFGCWSHLRGGVLEDWFDGVDLTA